MKKRWIKQVGNIVVVFLCVSVLASCNQGKLKELESQNKVLTNQIDSLNFIINIYAEKEKRLNSFNSNTALEAFKKHVAFYCKNCDYKDFRVQEFSDYAFDISMSKRSNAEHIDHGWTGVVVRLTFQTDGKYNIQNLQGMYDFMCQ